MVCEDGALRQGECDSAVADVCGDWRYSGRVRTLTALLFLAACGGARGTDANPASSPSTDHGPTNPKKGDFPYELNPMIDLMNQSNYQGASDFLTQHLDQCKASKDCVYDAEIIYYNWANSFENVGDWQGARKTLQDCLQALEGDATCTERLADLESRHHF